MMVALLISAQVALASGGLALLGAWRLRRVPVITAAAAAILNRRASVGLVCGAITMTVLPLTALVTQTTGNSRWDAMAAVGAPALIVLLLALLPDVLRAARLRPAREGTAGDLTVDLGIRNPRVTPQRTAVAPSLAIVVVMIAVGIRSDDAYDAILRGLLDGAACIGGFAALGQYLGLRRAGDRIAV